MLLQKVPFVLFDRAVSRVSVRMATRRGMASKRSEKQQTAAPAVAAATAPTDASTTEITAPSTTANSSSTVNVDEMVQQIIQDADISSTTCKAGWCLREGLVHVASVDNGRLLPLIASQGPPSFYHSLKSCRHEPTDNIKAHENCFQSLCRIIAGQQLAGKAAEAIFKRLLATTQHNLTPITVISLVGENGKDLETVLQKPSGLSRAKARSIHDLSQRFVGGELSEDFLTNPKSTDVDIREALLAVKGIGPWTCDMFIMFHLEQPDIFPFGDLGVRKGVAKIFNIKNGKGVKGSLCQKKDLERATALIEPYRPYQSLLTYYMWRAADSKDVYAGVNIPGDGNKSENVTKMKATTIPTASPVTPVRGRKRKACLVTPS